MSKLKFFSSKEFLRTLLYIIIICVILFLALVFFLRINTRHGHFVEVPNLGLNLLTFSKFDLWDTRRLSHSNEIKNC